jgi:class 3 adenylate cyclase/tetratricopeptide (TPR) repeat protein
MTCAVCGLPVPDDARFCPNCGAVLAPSLGTEERKMVTILFADLVDSTGLAQQLDAERAREVLGRFYDVVSEELRTLRGQPEKFIGDAVMAVFGLPQVHEDDAVRAVRAGLAIRDRVRRLAHELGLETPLEVRIGIESGETATGMGPSGQLLVTGAVVNAAARLQSASRPGEVLVGETTRALTETSVSFGERRDVRAKGFDEGLPAYAVDGLTSRSARRTIPFVGRGHELTLLRDGFSRVVSSGSPLLVTVLGESGIGKTRLADEFIAGLGPETAALIGRGHLSSESATFAPVATIVREIADVDHGEPPDKVMRRLRELSEPWLEATEVERTLGRLGLVLGLSERRLEESVFVQDVQAGFLALVDGLLTERPVVLVFEDVHVFRPPMLDLIERLAGRRRRGSTPSMILVTARPELFDHRPNWGSAASNHVMLRLEPLSQPDAVQLARQAAGGRIEELDAAGIAARAGGNPFFIVESTGMLLRRVDDPSAGAGGALPPTVQAVVAARLDSLPPAHRDLARRLSVYLYSFDVGEAELVAQCGVDDLRELEDAEIVVRDQGGGSDSRWRLRHETLRDVAYASLPKRERLRLHLRIADALLAADHISYAADHLERAALASRDLSLGDTDVPERAAGTLAAAGDRARRRMENRTAIDYYERALAIGAPDLGDAREAKILAGMGEARYWLGEYPAARSALERAVDIATPHDDVWALAHALRFLGDIAINVDGDVDGAEQLLARSLDAAERYGDARTIGRTLLFAGWVPWTRDRFADAEPVWRRALELARQEGDRWAEVRALTSLSINHDHMDDVDGATRLIEEAQQLAEEMGDQFSVAVTTVQRGRLHENEGRFDEAIPCFDAGIAIFGELGARWELADALAERGICFRELGRLDEAEADLDQAVHISEELGERQLAGWTWRALAKVAEKRGDRAVAEERWRRAEEEDARRPR